MVCVCVCVCVCVVCVYDEEVRDTIAVGWDIITKMAAAWSRVLIDGPVLLEACILDRSSLCLQVQNSHVGSTGCGSYSHISEPQCTGLSGVPKA